MIFPASAVFFGREKPACRKAIFADKNKEMMEAEMDEHIGYENLSGRMRMTLNVIIETDTRIKRVNSSYGNFDIYPIPCNNQQV